MAGAGYGISDGAGGFVTKLEGDGDAKIGDSSGDVIQITGSLEVNGDIKVNQYIYHNGDGNTLINFAEDKIILKAGGKAMVTVEEKASSPHEVTINDGANNVDFVVKGNGSNAGNPAFKVDASNNRVGINGVGEPSVELDVSGDVNFDGAAVFNESSAAKDFRVESNHHAHMFYIHGGSNRIGIGNISPQTLIDAKDPFYDVPGFETDAVLRLASKKSVGIKLVADTDNADESDNPYVDFYADGNADTSGRNNRKGSLALEATAGTTFTGSLADAFFMDAFYPLIGHSSRPLQIANASTNGGHAARITLEGTNGYVGIHTTTPTHSLEVSGDFKATEEVILGTTSTDLGDGTTSTLTPASSVHLLDATSIQENAAFGAHIMTIADGTTAGQILKIILNTTTNNVLIGVSTTNILGSYSGIAFENDKQGAAFEFVWTGSKWAMISKNPLATAG